MNRVLITQENNRYVIAKLKGNAFTLKQRMAVKSTYSIVQEQYKRRQLRKDKQKEEFDYEFNQLDTENIWQALWTSFICWAIVIGLIYKWMYS